MKYQVYQLNISIFVENGNFKSEELAKKHFDITFHSSVQSNDMHMYNLVCEIEANNLDEMFEIGNIGPEEKITYIDRMHSISVGDVICDEEGNYSVVAKVGFKPLPEIVRKEVA